MIVHGPLVFLHGFLGSPRDAAGWRLQLETVPIIAPTLGIADSWDKELDRLARELPARSSLAGYSLGARVALGLAVRSPQQWQSLIMISGSPGLRTAHERAMRREADRRWCEWLQDKSTDEFLHAWYQQEVFAGDPADVIAKLRQERKNVDRAEAAQILSTLSVAHQPDLRDRLSELAIPVLLLVGQYDPKYRQLAEEMAQRLPNVELRVIAGAGHALHRSHPDETFRTIRQFLQVVDRVRSTPRDIDPIGNSI